MKKLAEKYLKNDFQEIGQMCKDIKTFAAAYLELEEAKERLAQCHQALGMAYALAPKVGVNVDDPVAGMKEIIEANKAQTRFMLNQFKSMLAFFT